ncbi:PREDICTED: protein SHI RELATED SEQUENCE 5 [Tarenaya hassleriana]|uniref:protein SHI RELATED SEQUENCE 5 n=1 Tax=Tarenaya hassleriana TaxID=28532 RepID=UPI00053C6D6E|nr:PREDICTED: protein SHI RELATED SEQUENCE 5 [Tarenaya hassleriana]
MAGFFYLGGGRDHHNNKQDHNYHHHHHHQDKDQEDKSNYLYLYKDEIYNNNKGFELWPPQYFQEQQQHVSPANFYSLGMVPNGSGSSSNNNNNNNNINRCRSLYFNVVSDEPLGSSGGFTVTRQGGMNCQDCGNQAKKDCAHMRCRTCCKSRGFQCQTHVKSTWVPAAKRRERQAQLAALQHQQGGSCRGDNAKRLHEPSGEGGDTDDGKELDHGVGASALAVTRVVNANSSGLEIGHFPPEVSSPAVFRCVRVSSIDDEDEEYAYQTAVNIGGHIFKGILYDQGPDHSHNGYNSSPKATAAANANAASGSSQHLNLLASTANAVTTAVTAGNNNNNASSWLDSASLYPAPLNAFIAGTPFFPPPRS